MNTDLKDQVRAYAGHFVEGIDPVNLNEIVGRDPSMLTARPQDRRTVPRWAVGLAATLAVVLVVGGTAVGVWLFAGSGDREVVQQPNTTSETTTSIASTTLPDRDSTVTTVPASSSYEPRVGDGSLVIGTRPSSFRYPLVGGGFFDFDEQVETGRPFVLLLWWPYPSILSGDPENAEFATLANMQVAHERFSDKVDFIAVAKTTFEGLPDVELITAIKDQFGFTFDFAYPEEDGGWLWATRTPATVALFDQHGRVLDGYFGDYQRNVLNLVGGLPSLIDGDPEPGAWPPTSWSDLPVGESFATNQNRIGRGSLPVISVTAPEPGWYGVPMTCDNQLDFFVLGREPESAIARARMLIGPIFDDRSLAEYGEKMETILGGNVTRVGEVQMAGYPGIQFEGVRHTLSPPGIRDFYGWNGNPGTFIVFDTGVDGLYFAFYGAEASVFDTFAAKASRLAESLEIVTDRTGEALTALAGSDC